MSWHQLKELTELEQVHQLSFDGPVLYFKHSPRCAISNMAHNRVQSAFPSLSGMHICLVNVLEARPVSNEISIKYQVEHASPQILLIYRGECILDASHMDIRPDEILEEAERALGKKNQA